MDISFLNQSICVLSIFSFSIKSEYSDLMERIKSDPELCERLGIESAEEEVRKASEKTLQK